LTAPFFQFEKQNTMKNLNTIVSLAALTLTSAALAHHHHVTIKTPTGTPGEQIQVVVGYYPDEADMSIGKKGNLLDGGAAFNLNLPGTFGSGVLAGQHTGTGFSFTSDYYAQTGLLNGGDFYYQITNVQSLDGAECVMSIASTDPDTGGISIEGANNGDSRIAQSIHVGIGGHPHGQLCACSQEGLYKVTFVAWDANGVYADSRPFTMIIDSHLNLADLDQDGAVGAADLGALLGAWGTPGADINGDGTTDGADMAMLLSSWG
jgi:hypothetical protein